MGWNSNADNSVGMWKASNKSSGIYCKLFEQKIENEARKFQAAVNCSVIENRQLLFIEVNCISRNSIFKLCGVHRKKNFLINYRICAEVADMRQMR